MRAWSSLVQYLLPKTANGSLVGHNFTVWAAKHTRTLARTAGPPPFFPHLKAPWRTWKGLGKVASFARQRGNVGIELGCSSS